MSEFEYELADIGEGISEAELVAWHVDEGDPIGEDEKLCAVETDKAQVEIPAPRSGVVTEFRFQPGDIIDVGSVIAVIETDAPVTEATTKTETRGDSEGGRGSETRPTPSTETATASERVFAAPSTRRYARQKGVELAGIAGSGPHGRVLKDDVDEYLASVSTDESGTDGPEETVQDDVVRRPLKGVRKQIADHMTRSKDRIPHVSSGYEADAEALVEVRNYLDGEYDAPVSYTAIFTKVLVPALEQYPMFNASVDEESGEILEKHYYNIGVATHTNDGLIVPVIKNADEKSLITIAQELSELATQARNRSIEPEKLQDGTFTLTNVGNHDSHGTFATPIINHPQSAILGVQRIQNKPIAVTDSDIEVRKRIGFNLSFDHRIVDGITAIEFMNTVIETVENPYGLLRDLE